MPPHRTGGSHCEVALGLHYNFRGFIGLGCVGFGGDHGSGGLTGVGVFGVGGHAEDAENCGEHGGNP